MIKIKPRKSTILIVLAILTGSGILVRWFSRRGDQEPTFATATVEKGTITATVSASGNLLQTNAFTVTTQATGVIKNVFVKDGTAVKKGDKLVEITLDQNGEPARSKAWASYLSAKNGLASAEENQLSLEKGVVDAQSKLITAQQNAQQAEDWDPTDKAKQKLDSERRSTEIALELAERKYRRADDSIEKAQADLNSAWISYRFAAPVVTAPQSGQISDISVAPGMVLSSNGDQKLMTVAGEPRPLASATVNEIDIPKVAPDQKVNLTFDALPSKTFTGKIVGVDRTGTQTQGVVTYPILIQLDTGGNLLFPNMSAVTEIIIETRENVLWVPPQAIKERGGPTIVRVLIDGQVQTRQVEVGLETLDRSEIVSGLTEGETIIVSDQTPGGEALFGGGVGGFGGMMRPGGRQ